MLSYRTNHSFLVSPSPTAMPPTMLRLINVLNIPLILYFGDFLMIFYLGLFLTGFSPYSMTFQRQFKCPENSRIISP